MMDDVSDVRDLCIYTRLQLSGNCAINYKNEQPIFLSAQQIRYPENFN